MECRANRRSTWKRIVRVITVSAVAVLALDPVSIPVKAGETASMGPAAVDRSVHARYLELGVSKSVVIDLPREAKDMLVADPKIANAVIRSPQRAYIIGTAVGQTNIVFFDTAGQAIVAYDIAIKRDLNGIRAAMKQTLPNVAIRVEGLGDSVILSGSAASPVEAQQAGEIAARLVGGPEKVVNGIVVKGRDQVMLKVSVAEVQRNVLKQLGVDLSASMNYGTAVVNFNNSNPFTVNGGPLVSNNAASGSFAPVNGVPSVTATLRAMESAGVVRTLAEPNLTAISGESASFIAGGEFPVPAGYSCDPVTHVCTTQISYKKFGISLNFTPVVLSEGRISLRVMTEVSEISIDNSITLTQAVTASSVNSVTVPSIKTRRAETTLEIPSGGSMALAGLIQEQTKQAINGLPGLAELPVLGTLFRSRDYVNHETELMVLVTPLIVRSVAQRELSRPDDGFADAADIQTVLLGSINRIYGAPVRGNQAEVYTGNFGFITD
ncbi:MAG: type II and III secretion system protein family protein [Xanthobacteraceae bacterium]|nr:type II and III secretion system protein family protein [Xanthobacteraceae bacterium]